MPILGEQQYTPHDARFSGGIGMWELLYYIWYIYLTTMRLVTTNTHNTHEKLFMKFYIELVNSLVSISWLKYEVSIANGSRLTKEVILMDCTWANAESDTYSV